MSVDLVTEATQNFIDLASKIGKPDAIITDAFLTASALAAEALNVPVAIAGWPATADLQEAYLYPVQKHLSDESIARMSRLYDHFGLEGINFSKGATPSVLSPYLHITYFTETWYQADAPHLLDQNIYVGGKPSSLTTPAPDWLQAIPQTYGLGLVTLGTVFTGDPGFFSWAAHAVRAAGLVPIVVIGNNPITPEDKAELVKHLPPDTRLLKWVDFNHVLPRCKLVIHHGGMGTTHAMLVHGLPQIVVPHAADQRGQARRVAESKVGLNLTAHDVRQGKLKEGTMALIKDETVQKTARQFAEDMHSRGGPDAAARAIIDRLL